MMSFIILVFGLLMFVGLVVVHELGHFFAARRNGVEVEEFGIGFPPRARVLKKAKGTVYSLNWLPLGGFVKLKGEHDDDTEKGSYGAARLKDKSKILLAGVAMNFFAAFVLFTFLALIGLPKADLKNLPFYDKEQFTVASDTKIVSNQVYISVVPDSPASKAGLKSGDELLRVGDTPISSAEKLPDITESYKGQTTTALIKRGGAEQTINVTLNTERGDKGYLGVSPANSQAFRATWSAPLVGAVTTWQFTEVSFRGLGYVVGNLFAGQAAVAGEAVGGPVATFKIISDTSSLGLNQVLFVIALISVSLGVMNILPIPALDGGRLFVTLLFRATKKPLKRSTEEWIHGTGFAALMVLIVVITVVDIKRFF